MEAASTFVVIKGASKVVVPVRDYARAMSFWTECLGFEVTRDRTYGDERWIEVAPPRPVAFSCEDIPQTYEELRRRGIEFPAPPGAGHRRFRVAS